MSNSDEKKTLTEAQKLEQLANGLILQAVARFKVLYKDYTNEQLLALYHEQQLFIEQEVKKFRDKISFFVLALEEIMKEKRIKY